MTALTVVLLLASAGGIWNLREAAIANVEDDNRRLGVVLAEQTTGVLESVDLVLQQFADKVASSGINDQQSLRNTLGGQEIHEVLAKYILALPQAEAFTIVDASGHLVNGSRQWPEPGYSLDYQEYFRYLSQTVTSGPYISKPGRSRSSGAATVFMARRLTAGDGTFLGVIVSPIRLDYFSDFLLRSHFTDGRGVTILRRDGVALVRFPPEGVTPGTKIAPNSEWYGIVAHGGGHYLSSGGFANVSPSFISAHVLSLFPVVVDVTRQESAALAGWRRQALVRGTLALAAAVIITLLLGALGRQITTIERWRANHATTEARLAAQTARLATTLEHIDQGLMMVDAAGIIGVWNRRALEILGIEEQLILDHPRFEDLVEAQRQRGEFSKTELTVPAMMSRHGMYERRRPDGTVIEVRTAPLADGGLVRTYTDVTARTAAEEMLGVAASRDHLTGLPNRNGFSIGFENGLTAARRSDGTLAVLCLDLDSFKPINDKYGHAAGDQLLIQVAQRIRQVLRSSDVIGRLGGDEFAIVLAGIGHQGAEHTCHRILEAIGTPFAIGDDIARVGVSIGVAYYPEDGATTENLLRNADIALYKAKEAGRNSWRAFASADGEREHQRMVLEQDLRGAIGTTQFSLAYQPIFEAATGDVLGFEALLRWDHPRRGPISPSDFIPMAERIGLVIPLGRWVIETACAEAAAWAMPLHVAVNLSPAQFLDRQLLGMIQDVLARTGLSPARLELEVTEGLLLDQTQDVVDTMKALRAMGIRLVLDDFGTAHSNLSYLYGFPFDAVKIDRSFLRALSTEPQARALVEAILAMARALGLDTVGEGVETQEQLTLLRHLGCRWVQGYLLGYPAPSKQTRDWIWKLAADTMRTSRQGPPKPPTTDSGGGPTGGVAARH